MKRLFEGETGAIRDNVILNTAAGLLICQLENSMKKAIKRAEENIDNGKGLSKLNSLAKL